MLYRVIVFDYDGTLVMSNDIKRDAYFKVLPGHEAIVAAVLKSNPGDSRREIIRKCLLRVNPRWSDREDAFLKKVEAIAEEYDHIATNGAASCPERAGVTAGLAWLSERMPLYLLSATPQDSLERIVSYRGWERFFCKVVGVSVVEKANMLKAFALEQRVHAWDILMVGDSHFDRDAADSAGTAYFNMACDGAMQAVLHLLGAKE